ncbi:MAG: nitroreductase [Planctomycetaceae bacterium]|nr:nitroreductase [Planctomycetaceae bacterium]
MSAISSAALLRQLNWRYATKKFDPARKISVDDWQALEQVLVLTPSSFGLQPWKFVVVTDPALRQQLVAHSWRQSQVTEASHLVVLAIKKDLGEPEIDRYLARIAEVRAVALESLAGFRKMLIGSLVPPKDFDINEWATRQAYIALGSFMTAAAVIGIDTCPMEGIDPAKYDQVLGLDTLGYATVVACPAGYRAHDDKYAAIPKVRFKTDDVILRI